MKKTSGVMCQTGEGDLLDREVYEWGQEIKDRDDGGSRCLHVMILTEGDAERTRRWAGG